MVKEKDPSAVSFRRRLLELRTLRGLTQAELAERAQLPAAAISHFETGIRFPSGPTLERLADALRISVDHLLGRAEPPDLAGPHAKAIFRNLQKLSEESLNQLEQFSEMLRKGDENKRRKERS